jgi:hypothetical protein
MEKEMDYRNAADCYEKAWKLEFEASATVGFKLAFNYLKCDLFVEAIDICEKVRILDIWSELCRCSHCIRIIQEFELKSYKRLKGV